MDIDPPPGSSAALTLVCTGLPKIDESNVMEFKNPREKFIELLDMLETRVEKMRKDAAQLEEDKDHLLSTLDSFRNQDWLTELAEHEKDDVSRYADRIVSRCLTVEVRVLTQRDQQQEDALHHVNHLIDMLVISVKSDAVMAKAKCLSYMNACSSHMVDGVTDKIFESALLGCTLDDQKRVKKRLQGLLHYFDKMNLTTLQ